MKNCDNERQDPRPLVVLGRCHPTRARFVLLLWPASCGLSIALRIDLKFAFKYVQFVVVVVVAADGSRSGSRSRRDSREGPPPQAQLSSAGGRDKNLLACACRVFHLCAPWNSVKFPPRVTFSTLLGLSFSLHLSQLDCVAWQSSRSCGV